MLRRLRTLAAAAVLAAGPAALQAQSSPSRPAPDQVVRLTLLGGSGTVEGRVVGWSADTLVVSRPILNGTLLNTSMRIPRASIASYQLGLGRDHGRGLGRGVRTGALIGGTIGLALVLLGATMDNECSEFCIPPVVVGGVLGVGTTLGGVVLGGIVGTMAAPEIWGEPQQVAAAGGPRRARLGVTLSLARR